MKKSLVIISFIFPLILLSSCSNKNVFKPSKQNTVPKVTKVQLTIKDYFSFKENTKYVYEGKGNEYATYNVFVDYLTANNVQLRYNNGGTETVKVIENKDGKLIIQSSKVECYYRENLTQKTSSNGEVLLEEPLIKGTTWTLADNRKRFISNDQVEVITTSGKYKTLEVTTQGK